MHRAGSLTLLLAAGLAGCGGGVGVPADDLPDYEGIARFPLPAERARAYDCDPPDAEAEPQKPAVGGVEIDCDSGKAPFAAAGLNEYNDEDAAGKEIDKALEQLEKKGERVGNEGLPGEVRCYKGKGAESAERVCFAQIGRIIAFATADTSADGSDPEDGAAKGMEFVIDWLREGSS